MFEFFFKYPPAVYSQGKFLFLAPWPVWLLAMLVVGAAGLLAWRLWHGVTERDRLTRGKKWTVWALQSLFAALALLMLWRPALSVAALREQQNVLAIVADTSRSMALADAGRPRMEQVKVALDSGAARDLGKRYQVRHYSASDAARRVARPSELTPIAPVTRLADSVASLLAQEQGVPLGAVVLISDGSENSGGIDRAKLDRILAARVPVYTVGAGKTEAERDIEVESVSGPTRTLSKSRVTLYVAFAQRGFAGQRARLTIQDAGKTLTAKEVTLASDGTRQVESVLVRAGDPGLHLLEASIEPLKEETNTANNRLTHVVNVSNDQRRILYLEGEPRWEYKFIRRALDDDEALELVSAMRTTQNKIYRQGVKGASELENGFPSSVDELFGYHAVILGSVNSTSLSSSQQTLLGEFVNRRGGGLLFLAGRESFSETGWQYSQVADLVPTILPGGKGTFRRDAATAKLTTAGFDSPITRLVDDREQSAKLWAGLPPLGSLQDIGAVKPGAQTLLEASGKPLLATQWFGRGRTAALATGGTWRWQMQLDHKDLTHETFWRQLIRWLATETPGPVSVSASRTVLEDSGEIQLRAEVRDKNYQPASDAEVTAEITGPDGRPVLVRMQPDARDAGQYSARWQAPLPGNYLARVSALRGDQLAGQDVLSFRREDGVAESFRTYQNRDLLERLAKATGGRYYPLSEFERLTREIVYTDAGISTREARELWDMPALFLLAVALRAGEWLLRRKWGVV